MVVINPPPPCLSPDIVSVFYTTDELLSRSPVLIFYGPSSTTTVASTNSRIQAHVYSPAGLQSYPRLTISPSSSLYTAVNCLPREEQGDDICRGLAFSLFKYFSELPEVVKSAWEKQPNPLGRLPSAPKLFSDAHAAILASRMVKVENAIQVIQDVRCALAEQSLSWLDLDVVLPPDSMKEVEKGRESIVDDAEVDVAALRYGDYAPLVKRFGDPAFLPTARLKRAPSKPTAINRSSTFTRRQKETLRREMCELLDTEGSYVSKVYDLIHSVAEDFRQKARNKATASTSPSEQALRGLFPPSIDEILQVNTKFLENMRVILEETENDAIQDIESTTDDDTTPNKAGNSTSADVTGALAVAKCLLDWFPRFANCYADYIQAHAEFSQLLRIFMKETGSSFSKRVQATGEQRLMSMLIEPVQRLPRYNLYIDNIVKQLPMRHPALKPFLKARDIISEICSRDTPSSQQVKVLERLRHLCPTWPQHFRPQGRLVTAMDVVELPPPYRGDVSGSGVSAGVLLLFIDYLVILCKPVGSTLSARGVLAEIDSQLPPTSDANDRGAEDLVFRQQMNLSKVEFSELDGGRSVQLMHLHSASKRLGLVHNEAPVRVYHLGGAYEGKAARWVEEVVKAKVEGRFSESERESHKWEVRSTECGIGGDLSLFSAIFEEAEGQEIEGRREPARVRVVIDPAKGSRSVRPGQEGIEVVASLSVLGEGFYRLEIEGISEYGTRDQVTAGEFLPVFVKRLSNILQMRNQIRYPAITATLLLRNQQILQSLEVKVEGSEDEGMIGERMNRPTSPVKILSNLFGGSVMKETSTLRKLRPPATMGDIPRMMPPPSTPSQLSLADTLDDGPSKSTAISNPSDPAEATGAKLEATLASYVLALHARKGNIVGRALRARANADELAVNELYNALLENPGSLEGQWLHEDSLNALGLTQMLQAAAQAPVDVLFAAFEKFLNTAWKESIGPVISRYILAAIQTKADSFTPQEFEEYFFLTFGDLSAPNQRALRSIVKLLADLLDGTGNDGDRGILTAAFAEVLVPDGKANEFISLLDRFVEDYETLFAERTSERTSPSHESNSTATRERSANTGSLSSNTSSLRRKFGFGTLTRKNSKLDGESEAGSVWRTLSKSNRGGTDSQPSSISKGSLARSNSTDVDARFSPKRPVSRDRPTVLGAFSFEQNPTLGTIGENSVPNGPPRKKRRSSLSDLKTLQQAIEANPSLSPATITPRRFDPLQRHSRQISASPLTPSPTKPSHIPSPSHSNMNTSPLRLASPSRKENTPVPSPNRQHSTIKARPTSSKPDEITITNYGTIKRRTDSVSGIPTLKPNPSTGSGNSPVGPREAPKGLSERPTAGNIARTPPVSEKPSISTPTSTTTTTTTTSSPRKLRMQSPQKLRERLQTEQKALSTTSSTLTAELSKIGDEIAAMGPGPNGSRPTTTSKLHADANITGTAPTALAARLQALETKLPTLLAPLNSRIDAIAADVASSLQVSEARARRLDELYREAGAENEALYARFNEELARVVKGVTGGGGDGVGELKNKLREAQEEAGVLRKENWRLKREVGGLRAQLRE